MELDSRDATLPGAAVSPGTHPGPARKNPSKSRNESVEQGVAPGSSGRGYAGPMSTAPADPIGTSGLTRRILIGMAAGLAVGLVLNLTGLDGALAEFLISGLLYVGGAIFLASLKLLVVPLVFVSLVCGTAALEDLSRLGRLGGRTLVLYLFTTAVAITLAITAAAVIGARCRLRSSDGPRLRGQRRRHLSRRP